VSYSDKLEELQRLKAEVRRLERQAETEAKRMRPITELDERQMTSMQARADEAYQAAGRRAPAPLALESPDEFRRRLVIGLQGYSPRWQKADLGSLVDDALPIAESQVFADALQHGRTAGLQAREIRERVRTDHSGHGLLSSTVDLRLTSGIRKACASSDSPDAGRVHQEDTDRSDAACRADCSLRSAPDGLGSARRVLSPLAAALLLSPAARNGSRGALFAFVPRGSPSLGASVVFPPSITVAYSRDF
jgi:hypothetical protein